MADHVAVVLSSAQDRVENRSTSSLWTWTYPAGWRGRLSRSIYLSPEYKARKADEFYKTYDVMVGVKIAATLGALIALFVLFVLYKSKCKPGQNGKVKNESSDSEVRAEMKRQELPGQLATRENKSDTVSVCESIPLCSLAPILPSSEQIDIPLTVISGTSPSHFLPSDEHLRKVDKINDHQLAQSNGWTTQNPNLLLVHYRLQTLL
ncbi:uncharacterized protein LOC143247695 [Tachypleus tridentatus]|uniref:uncharacterized protein LOC143247695 n=1 Tax=Tachypleus tridentatus TaxID=6853 RepID=UPI003FD0DC34